MVTLRREVLRFLRLGSGRLPRDLQARVKKAIQAGPRRGQKPQSEKTAQRGLFEIGLRYYKFREGGGRLDRKASALADSALSPTRENAAECPEEFLLWTGEARWITPEELIPQELISKPLIALVDALRQGTLSAEGFEGLTLLRPVKCFSALKRLAGEDLWPVQYWKQYFWAVNSLHQQKQLRPNLQLAIAHLLKRAPDALFGQVGAAAASFALEVSKSYPIAAEALVASVWRKAWSGIKQMPEVVTDDVLTEALNHAGGKLAEAALERLWKYAPKVGGGLPEPTRHYFDAMAVDPAGHLARVMLVTRLHHLFSIDANWTTANLIARLQQTDSREGADLWSAYGWSPTVGPNLLAAFKEAYLEVLRHFEARARRDDNLVALFAIVCLDNPSAFTQEEIRSVVERLPEEALVTIAHTLEMRIKAKPERSAVIWQQAVLPWLSAYWPTSSQRNTEKTSNALVGLLLKSGDAFPDAVSWAVDYLKPGSHRSFYELSKSDLPAKFPGETLSLLGAAVSEAVLKSWEKDPLKNILDAVSAANPNLRGNQRFQRLYKLASG